MKTKLMAVPSFIDRLDTKTYIRVPNRQDDIDMVGLGEIVNKLLEKLLSLKVLPEKVNMQEDVFHGVNCINAVMTPRKVLWERALEIKTNGFDSEKLGAWDKYIKGVYWWIDPRLNRDSLLRSIDPFFYNRFTGVVLDMQRTKSVLDKEEGWLQSNVAKLTSDSITQTKIKQIITNDLLARFGVDALVKGNEMLIINPTKMQHLELLGITQ